jgi:hypothetical protein
LYLEAGLAIAIVAGVAYAAWFALQRGYLPQPFYRDPSDTFMDLYNTAYWANHDGAYEIWRSIYPPLSFVLLKLVTTHKCYVATASLARSCDGGVRAWLFLAYAANWALLGVYYFRQNPSTALMRTVATAAGLPMLYALERGNLVIVALAALLAAAPGLLKANWLRALFFALAFNLKPYIFVLWAPYLLGRRWSALALTMLAVATIYALNWALEGSGSPLTLVVNVGMLMRHTAANTWNNLYYATTYWRLIAALTDGFPPGVALAAWAQGLIRFALTLAIVGGQIGAGCCLALAAIRPKRIVGERLMAVALLLSFTSFGASGYSAVLLLPLAFRERATGWLSWVVVASAYLLCLPADVVLAPLIHTTAYSYLGGRTVTVDFGFSLGQIVRPGLLLAMEYALIGLVLADVDARGLAQKFTRDFSITKGTFRVLSAISRTWSPISARKRKTQAKPNATAAKAISPQGERPRAAQTTAASAVATDISNTAIEK